MGREPPSHQRCVALAGVDVNVAVSVFAIAVDDVLAVESVVLSEWAVGTRSIGIDSQGFLLVVSQQELHGQFVSGFRWHDVALVGATVDQRENRRLVLRAYRAEPHQKMVSDSLHTDQLLSLVLTG